MDELILIDKEKGMTSFDVVRRVKRITGIKKVGHGGTLDPLATGLLIIGVGKGTKLLNNFLKCDKEYEVEAKFGFISDSYDADGRISEGNSLSKFTKKEVSDVIKENFLGEIEQFPPKYSALKIGGKRACDIMRRGGDVNLASRKIKIHEFKISSFKWPKVAFLIKCGSGTYVRSLVHDLGQKLGCGAYVTELRRTKVGEYSVKNSESLFLLHERLSCL